MYVCLCRAVSDGMVRAAIDRGARTREEIERRTGAGTVCGGCRATIETLLEERHEATDESPRKAGPG